MLDFPKHLVCLNPLKFTCTPTSQHPICLICFSFYDNLLHLNAHHNMEEKICRYFHCILTWDISKFTSKTTYSKIVTSNLDVSIRVFIAYAGSLPPRGPILLVMAYRRMRSSLTYITNIRSIRSSSVSSPLRGPWEQSLNVMFCLTWKVWVSAPFSADTTVNSRTDVEVITENRKKGWV